MTQNYININEVFSGQVLSASSINEIIYYVKQLQETTPKNVLEKCDHCGHWGAVMCECPKCDAPIDPKHEEIRGKYDYSTYAST